MPQPAHFCEKTVKTTTLCYYSHTHIAWTRMIAVGGVKHRFVSAKTERLLIWRQTSLNDAISEIHEWQWSTLKKHLGNKGFISFFNKGKKSRSKAEKNGTKLSNQEPRKGMVGLVVFSNRHGVSGNVFLRPHFWGDPTSLWKGYFNFVWSFIFISVVQIQTWESLVVLTSTSVNGIIWMQTPRLYWPCSLVPHIKIVVSWY